jgi:predicted RNA binding protein YcfA (HicA-like mRNA interferase family)
MSRAKRLTGKEVLKILQNNGFQEISQNGSHVKLFNSINKRSTVVPIHQSQILPIGTLKSIEKQSGLKFL